MKKIGKLVSAIAVLVAMTLLLCSCSSTGDFSAYMTAPRVAGEMSDISDAFYKAVGRSVTLSYPSRGDNLSAFVLEDIDGDGVKEALVFYTADNSNNGVAPVRINVIDKHGDDWVSADDIVTASNSVDMVSFADVSGDGAKEAVVGLTSVTKNENKLSLFNFDGGKLNLVLQEDYTDFILSDMTGSGIDDLLVVNLKTVEKEATAKLYSVSGNEPVLNGTAYLDGNATGYAKLQEGTVGGTKAIYIDAYKGTTSMVTDIVFIKDGTLTNPFISSVGAENEYTLRTSTEICRDCNGDGVLDIPFTKLMPGFELRVSSERAYLTTWRSYDGALFHDTLCGYFNTADGYMIRYPELWIDAVTITRDSSSHMLTFGVYDSIRNTVSNELFRIKRYAVGDYEQVDNSAFIELGRDDSYIYVARIVDSTSEYSVDGETLKQMFSLL